MKSTGNEELKELKELKKLKELKTIVLHITNESTMSDSFSQ